MISDFDKYSILGDSDSEIEFNRAQPRSRHRSRSRSRSRSKSRSRKRSKKEREFPTNDDEYNSLVNRLMKDIRTKMTKEFEDKYKGNDQND